MKIVSIHENYYLIGGFAVDVDIIIVDYNIFRKAGTKIRIDSLMDCVLFCNLNTGN